jgi:hypothetical protein
MDEHTSQVLYYPNFNPADLRGIKRSLLLYDGVNLIAPTTTPFSGSILSGSSGEDLLEISPQGALGGGLHLPAQTEVVKIIPDLEIVQKRRDEIIAALGEDLNDTKMHAWEGRWKARHHGRTLYWYVTPDYFGQPFSTINEIIDEVIDDPNRKSRYKLEQFHHADHGELLRVPFFVGMSLGVSEALWAAVDRDFALFTDDSMSDGFLLLRLRRGWNSLTQDPDVQEALGIEQRFAKDHATASLGAWTLRTRVPELVKKASDMSVTEVIELRDQSGNADALREFRSGLADLVQSSSLWEAGELREFQNEAHKLYEDKILPAFEQIEGKSKLSVKDVLLALDWKNTIQDTAKAAPALFMQAAVPVAAGSAIALGPVAAPPVALLTLACGVGARFVTNVIEQVRNGRKVHRSAQFLTYPLDFEKALH